MTEQEIIEQYPAICIWLGFKMQENRNGFWYTKNGTSIIHELKIDFLNDRNQQKWIEDRLIELGYRIGIHITEIGSSINIFHIDDLTEFKANKDSLDLALLQAIEQLIDKENENNKRY